MEPTFITSADGVRIATYEQGNPDGPTLVLAHGWPDSHVLWDGVVALLADRFRIVTFDNRGVGASTVPAPVAAYRMERFADDLEAVLAATSRGARARPGSRLGLGGDVGVPGPPRCRRPGGLVHLGLRSEHRPLQSGHLA